MYAGLIGSLELQVPWKALWTAPTKVVVEDLVLLVVPKEAAPYKLVQTLLVYYVSLLRLINSELLHHLICEQ